MWLDRLAGQSSASGGSTPQPGSRPFTPLPRKPSSGLSPYVTSQRQGHSPRSSSLSLASTESSISLLASSRRPNGSGLKQSSTIVDHTPATLAALEKLLGKLQSDNGPDSNATMAITEADLDIEFDFKGKSLKDFASTTDAKAVIAPSKRKTHAEYEKEQTEFEELHRSITACDNILNSVETNLESFRNDLAAVAADIESLQDRSAGLNKRLENRQEVEKALAPLVEELSVSPETITKIVTGPIDETWAKTLSDVDRRAAAHKKKTADSQRSKANEDLGPLLEKLMQKAIERIRDFIVAQIKSLRSPSINAQIIQQQNFLKFKDLFTFLHKHHTQLADEIALAYMNTMRWYYVNQFTRYEKALGKVKLHVLTKSDTLGYEDSTGLAASMLSVSRSSAPPHDAFNLGRRGEMLKAHNQPAISSYLAEEDQATHYLEVPFRNFNLAMIDNAAAEYTFLATYFSPSLSFGQISKNFHYIFEPTFELGQTLTKTLCSDTYDALGIFLCIRLNQHFAFELQRRRVPAVDSYVNGTNMLLWPRLQVIMDRHCESVKALTTALPSKASKSDQAKLTLAPHMVTQRFGQLLQGFLALSPDAGDDEPVTASLQRLRTEVEAFLTKMSNSFGADKRKSARFMYNNYSLIYTIIGDMTGKLAEEQQSHFEELKHAYQEND